MDDCEMFTTRFRIDRVPHESVGHLLEVEEPTESQWKVTVAVLLLDAGVVGGGVLGALGKIRTWMASWSL